MAVINFPDNPSDGATQTVGGITYTYSSSKGYWTAAASSGGGGGGGASVTTDDTAPTSPSDGDLWYDTDDGGMFVYYADTDSSQWVEVIGSQGATGAAGAAGADGGAGVASVYATIDLLPLSGNTQGDMAHVTANNTLYFWNGSGWYKIALINTNPSISGVSSSYALANDGTATTVTVTASDPEGLPITYSIASDTSGNIATVSQGTGASTNVFTITPSTNTAYAGSFTLTFRASDGVNIATAPATFTLEFIVQNSNYTTALITTAGNAGTNSTFTDSSSNSHTITANGNVTQTSFSPYRSGGYSALVGTSDAVDYLSVAQNASINSLYSVDHTIEFWFNKQSERTQNYILTKGGQTTREWGIAVQSSAVVVYWSTNGASSGDSSISLSTTIDLNKWYHLAVTFDSTTSTITVYLNGSSLGTGTFTSIYGGTGTLYIGKFMDYGAISHSCHAYIRDFRIVKGTKVYTSNFTPPTGPLTAITNTSLLACHLPYFADGSTNNHTITPNGATSIEPFGPYEYEEYAVGDYGGSGYFDGTGDYITTTLNSNFSSKSYTIEGWFYPSINLTGRYSLFNVGSGTSATDRITIGVYDGTFFHQHEVGNSNRLTVLSGGIGNYTLTAGQWHHFEMVFDWGGAYDSSSTGYIFMNGVLQETYTLSAHVATSIVELSRSDIAGGAKYFPGYISDFRVRQGTAAHTANFTPPTAPLTAVTNTSLLLNMQGAKIFDKSQSTENIALFGNTTSSTAQYKYLPTSMYFDGTGDYITSNILSLQGDWTVEFWAYCTSAGTQQSMVTFNAGSFNGMNIWRNTSNQLVVDDGQNAQSAFTGATLSTNTWEHIAIVRSGTTTTGYINGSSVGSHSFTPAAISAISIGRYNGGSYLYYNGYLSDVRVTKGLARYTANFTPPTAALQG